MGVRVELLNVSGSEKELKTSSTQTEGSTSCNTVAQMVSLLCLLPESEQLDVIGKVLQEIVCKQSLGIKIPDDFISLSVIAIQHLKACERSNVVYGVAKGIGTMRQDNSDSLIPARRMPMGLLEYLTNFFVSSHLSQVSKCTYAVANNILYI